MAESMLLYVKLLGATLANSENEKRLLLQNDICIYSMIVEIKWKMIRSCEVVANKIV